jgi:small GTP-binding protein
MNEDEFNMQEIITEEYKKLKAEFSSANILIAGKTGVGKSTLINAVFHRNLAQTASGKPVTQKIEKFSKPGIPINIYDTKGLELAEYQETLKQVKDHIETLRQKDADEHIHLAWVCLTEDSARLEDGETNLIKLLNSYNIPIILVITKAKKKDSEFKVILEKMLGNDVKKVIAVRAKSEDLEDDDGEILAKLKPMGLLDLVESSYRVIPEGKQLAFISAQKISLDLKREKVGTVIKMAATAAGAAATSPIPFSDSFMIVPIQVAMIIKITITYGIPLEEGAMTTLATSVVGCTAATAVGRSIVGNLLKLTGVGMLAGDMINAAVASSLTYALGELYNKIILELYSEALNSGSTEVDIASIVDRMQLEWKNR